MNGTNTPACRKVYEHIATCQLALTRQCTKRRTPKLVPLPRVLPQQSSNFSTVCTKLLILAMGMKKLSLLLIIIVVAFAFVLLIQPYHRTQGKPNIVAFGVLSICSCWILFSLFFFLPITSCFCHFAIAFQSFIQQQFK